MIQRATVQGKGLRSKSDTIRSKNHKLCSIYTRNIGPTGPISSTIPSPWIMPLPKGRSDMPWMIERAFLPWTNCVSITYGSFLDPSGLSCPHKKYWTHRSNILYQEKPVSQSCRVHFKTQRVCPINTRNIGPIGPISSTIPSHWIQSLPKGNSDMPWMIEIAVVPGKRLSPNHVCFIPGPTGSVLSTQEILALLVQYPELYHHLESSPYPKAGLIRHEWFKSPLYQTNGWVPIT